MAQAVSRRPHRGGPGSIPRQSTPDLWWSKWHWKRVFSQYFRFPLPVLFDHCSTLIFVYMLRLPDGKRWRMEIFQKETFFFWNWGALGRQVLYSSLWAGHRDTLVSSVTIRQTRLFIFVPYDTVFALAENNTTQHNTVHTTDRDITVVWVTWLRAASSGLRIPAGARDFNFPIISRSVLKTNQSPTERAEKAKRSRCRADHLVPRWRISGTVPSLPIYAFMAFVGKFYLFVVDYKLIAPKAITLHSYSVFI